RLRRRAAWHCGANRFAAVARPRVDGHAGSAGRAARRILGAPAAAVRAGPPPALAARHVVHVAAAARRFARRRRTCRGAAALGGTSGAPRGIAVASRRAAVFPFAPFTAAPAAACELPYATARSAV